MTEKLLLQTTKISFNLHNSLKFLEAFKASQEYHTYIVYIVHISHLPKISRPYPVPVPNYWTWTKSTPQKNWGYDNFSHRNAKLPYFTYFLDA